MFIVTDSPTFTHSVEVFVPVDGGHDKQTFRTTFNVVPSDIERIYDLQTASGSDDFLRAVVKSMDDLVDKDKKPVPYSDVDAVIDYLMDREATTPDDVRAKLRDLSRPGASPVTTSVEVAELIYARRDDLPPQLLTLGAAITDMLGNYDFHGMRSTGRGAGISRALRRIDGVSAPIAAAPTADPEAKAEYAADVALGEPQGAA